MSGPLLHADGIKRCSWATLDPLYVKYHDTEWGVPEWDDRALYEKLMLDGFQAGLSWITILRKRDHFRAAFDDFDPEKIARNRAKIEGAVNSAKSFLKIMESGPGFSKMLWAHLGDKPHDHKFRSSKQIPTSNDIALGMSKELIGHGFKFVGPTIVYAFMQAVGMVNDHLTTCHRHDACAKLAKKPTKRK